MTFESRRARDTVLVASNAAAVPPRLVLVGLGVALVPVALWQVDGRLWPVWPETLLQVALLGLAALTSISMVLAATLAHSERWSVARGRLTLHSRRWSRSDDIDIAVADVQAVSVLTLQEDERIAYRLQVDLRHAHAALPLGLVGDDSVAGLLGLIATGRRTGPVNRLRSPDFGSAARADAARQLFLASF